MKTIYCPDCNAVNFQGARYCSNCATNFAVHSPITTEQPNTTSSVRIILITMLITVCGVSIIAGSFYLGMSSASNNTLAQSNTVNTVSNSAPLPSVPVNTEINTNTAKSTPENSNTSKSANKSSNIKAGEFEKFMENENKKNEKKRLASEGFEAGWSYLTQTNDSPNGYYYFYRVSSMKVNSYNAEVWARKFPMYPSGFSKRNELAAPVHNTVEKIRFNCDTDMFFVDDETFFDSSGMSIPDKRRGYRTWQSIVPDTMTEALKEIACTEE